MAEHATCTRRKLANTCHSSMPLLIPNDTTYDPSSNELRTIPGEQRINLKLVPETLQLLKTIERPLAVLAIGGPCRTGKSYVLSRILGSADAFALGHTFDPKTLGIWIGTTVLDSQNFTILLMDTEGIDSVFAKSRDDACILVMTILLSSYFIYNSLGVPHHNDLDRMSYFANLASAIAINVSQEDTNAFDLKNYFPDFLWLLRDVHLLPTEDDGREVTPTEYLVSKVLRRGKSFKATTSDEVGRAILTFFPSVECKTIQAPSDNPDIVRNIAVSQNRLSPAFNEQVENLVQHLLQQLRPKRGFGAANLVDGPMLAAMAEDYLKAVNTAGAVPCITDTWTVAVEKRCEEVLKKLIEEYTQELEARIQEVGLPMEEDSSDDLHVASKPRTLFGIHRSILLKKTESLFKQVSHLVSMTSQTHNMGSLSAELENSIAMFEETRALGTEGSQTEVKKVKDGVLLTYAQKNYHESRSVCRDLFEELYQKIRGKIHNQQYSFEELLVDLKPLQLDYFRKAIGPAKWEVYDEKQDFMKAQEDSFKLLKGYQQQAYNAIQKAAEESARAAKAADGMNKLQVQMRNDSELNQKRIEAMQKEHQEEMERLRREEDERILQQAQKFDDFKAAHMQDMARMAEEHHEEMKQQYDEMMQAINRVVTQNKEEISNLNATIAHLSAKLQKACTTSKSWGDILVQVGKKALETGVTAAIGASKCSMM